MKDENNKTVIPIKVTVKPEIPPLVKDLEKFGLKTLKRHNLHKIIDLSREELEAHKKREKIMEIIKDVSYYLSWKVMFIEDRCLDVIEQK